MVFKQPRIFSTIKHEFDVKDVEAVGGVSLEQDLMNKWYAACHSTNGQFTLSNIHIGPVTFQGPCPANSNKMVVNVVGSVVAKPKSAWPPNNSDTWIKFEHVENLVITGTGNFNGQGLDWWNSCGGKALAFNDCRGLLLDRVTSLNSPRNHISISACNGATISNVNIMAPNSSPNTDGIDISNINGVNINGGHIGTGDDCIAINGNSFNINITNLNCGPGHGISVGSLGRHGAKDVVSNIRVIGATFSGTQNGVRIKTVPGGSGSASQITFSNITMENVQNPIILSQFYCPHVDPKDCKNKAQMVQISGVTFDDIHGTCTTPNAIDINCSENLNSCVGITLKKINIQAANRSFIAGSRCVDTNVQIIGSVFPRVTCIRAPHIIEMPLDYDYIESEPAIATN
ncbi:putative endo-polygalacturonase [Helianthus annuus]|nr:putative endo-polygalacturonase [Helianthus annuus]